MEEHLTIYDQVPYQDEPFTATHPQRLSALGVLFGLTPAKPNNCRVLELGAAKGNNLVGMAYAYPKSNFIGIDLSAKQVKEGNTTIKELGLKNIELINLDILKIDKSLGSFDYIIAHGVLSWVPKEVQEKIFSITEELLNPNGICYLSYNAYPGWKARDIFRDIMLLNADEGVNTDNLVKQGRKALEVTETIISHNSDSFSQTLSHEIPNFIHRPDWYYIHDFLAETNDPFYVSEIFRMADKYNLQYLSDSELSVSSTQGLHPKIRSILSQYSSDLKKYEQYLDIARMRSFRRTLLCKKEAKLSRSNFKNTLEKLLVAANLNLKKVETTGQLVTYDFIHANGGCIRASQPEFVNVLKKLSASWPKEFKIEDILNSISEDNVKEQVLGGILNGVFADLIEIRSEAIPFMAKASEFPISSKLARYQVEASTQVCTLLHVSLNLSEIEIEVIKLLDGSNTKYDVFEKALLSEPDLTIGRLEDIINKFALHALLVAPDS